METSLGNLACITYSFKHDQNKIWDSKFLTFISHKTMFNKSWQKGLYICARIVVQSCTLFMWLNITQKVLQSPFVLIFTKSNPLFGPCRHFEQETRLIKFCLANWLPCINYMHNCFDMQYWTLNSTSPLNINKMSNLVFISQLGHILQHLQ
jgi:hypothetical protein